MLDPSRYLHQQLPHHLALAPVLVTAPVLKLLTTDAVKAHLRVDGNGDDELIDALIEVVTDHLDGWTGILGRCLLPQTWRQDFPWFPLDYRIRLPLAPVTAISSITYNDAANAPQTLSTSVYSGPFADAIGSYIVLQYGQIWPVTYSRDDAASITFIAGYGSAAAVPASIRQAALLMIGDLYENRETVMVDLRAAAVQIPTSATVDALLGKYRRIGL